MQTRSFAGRNSRTEFLTSTLDTLQAAGNDESGQQGGQKGRIHRWRHVAAAAPAVDQFRG